MRRRTSILQEFLHRLRSPIWLAALFIGAIGTWVIDQTTSSGPAWFVAVNVLGAVIVVGVVAWLMNKYIR